MSVVQSAWVFFSEHHWYRDALDMLLDAYQRAPRTDLDEARQLITLTFELQRKHCQRAS
jgi:hypothetical protein